jgi:ubiquinone/menaquinone biosynthesis C-methylase UbiE
VNSSLDRVREAYDASASAWVAGPESAYDVMADVLLAAAPHDLRGVLVLDLGAGTGPAARAARRAGATGVIGVDVSPQMMREGSGWDCVVVGDVTRLPIRDQCVDLAVAACCLGHLPEPRAALVESRRVSHAVVASAFLTGWTHPAKGIVDAVAARHGFVVPSWYSWLKTEAEPTVDDPVRLAALARDAGYSRVDVTTTAVDVDVRTPEQLVTWRLGMAHLAPFAASLGPAERSDLRAECVEALRDTPPLVIPLVVLSAHDG